MGCKELLYFDYQPLSPEVEKEIGCRRVENLEEMLAQCDVVTINCPLHEKTKGLFNKELISKHPRTTRSATQPTAPSARAATRPSPTCPVPRSTPRSATPPAPSLSSSPTSAASTTTGLRT